MSVVDQAHARADPALLRRSLASDGEDVVVRETHCSVVFLVGDRVYKLRKPVLFDFVDLRLREARAVASRMEVMLNATLAPGIALGVRAIVPSGDGAGYVLGDDHDPLAIDHVVEMRRFDEGQTMRDRIERGVLTSEQASAVGARIALFDRDATVVREGIDYRELLDRNFEALLPLVDDLATPVEQLALQRLADAFLIEWTAVLSARASAGSVIDGHGDLRAEHVVFDQDDVLIVDRLEFEDLRIVDVADELGFLLMELDDLTGDQTIGEAVLAGYHAGGGTVQPRALVAFFGAHRAQVRAKVALLRAAQPGVDPAPLRARAVRLLALSRRLGWRARGPLLLLITGPPASGKSTLARALGQASGLPVLSSDAIRGRDDGVRPEYTPEARADVYGEVARRASREQAVIVDATFGDEQLQRVFVEQLERSSSAKPLVVECRVPAGVRVARATAREADGQRDSDAGPGVTRRLGERFVAMGAVAAGDHLAVDTRAPLAMQVDEVESWLDSLLAGGRIA